MEYFVLNNRFAYQRVLGRPFLKELSAITSIYHLCMKFPVEHSISTVKDDQRSARECYSNFFKKAESRDVNLILRDNDTNDDP